MARIRQLEWWYASLPPIILPIYNVNYGTAIAKSATHKLNTGPIVPRSAVSLLWLSLSFSLSFRPTRVFALFNQDNADYLLELQGCNTWPVIPPFILQMLVCARQDTHRTLLAFRETYFKSRNLLSRCTVMTKSVFKDIS